MRSIEVIVDHRVRRGSRSSSSAYRGTALRAVGVRHHLVHGPGTASFDFNSVITVPAPATLVLLGIGLVSVVVAARRRISK
jgi:hypothetical protein